MQFKAFPVTEVESLGAGGQQHVKCAVCGLAVAGATVHLVDKGLGKQKVEAVTALPAVARQAVLPAQLATHGVPKLGSWVGTQRITQQFLELQHAVDEASVVVCIPNELR